MEKKEVEQIVDAKLKELEPFFNHLKGESYDVSFKLEALLRRLVYTEFFSMDDYINSIIEHDKLQKKFKELKEVPEILNRVKLAKEYNALPETLFNVYADDIGAIQQVEAAGGCLPAVAEAVLSLPHSTGCRLYFEKYLAKDDKDRSQG